MEDLILSGTGETPEVHFSASSGVLKISGRAYSSGISFFFKKMDTWLDDYLRTPQPATSIELHLDYSNSIFKKLLMNFIKKAITSVPTDKKITIKWYFHSGDEDSIENGNLTAKTLNFPIEMIEVD